MIHGYHAIFCAYGFWLPNDPRGSWSDFVGAWELVRFGRATKSIERSQLAEGQQRLRQKAKRTLKYPPVQFTDEQVLAIGRGFEAAIRTSGFTVWACSILPEHVHLVIARHTFKVEQIVNLLKGAASRTLREEGVHPLARFGRPGHRLPTPWADRRWKVFLDSAEAIENATGYVEDNPGKERKPPQDWSFITPFRGLESGWVTYH
jgi:REP element-mobilizing transposase RayT